MNPKWKKGLKITLLSVAALVLALSLAIVVYWGCIGVTDFDQGVASLKKLLTPRANDVFYRDTYSVSDEEAKEDREVVVATVGGEELTNGGLQVYYWMNVLDFLDNYGYTAVYEGLDYTQPLDQQTYQKTGGSWQQYFLDQALTNYHHYQAMSLLALEEGIVTAEELEKNRQELRASMTEVTLDGGYPSLDAMIQADVGAGSTFDDYSDYVQVYYAGYAYFNEKYGALEAKDEEIATYFAQNEESLAEQGVTKDSGNVMDVRHILIAVEGGTEDEDGNMTYSDAEWEVCREEAQALLDQWLAGDATEETFAQLAEEHSQDTGSNENGGLYQGVNEESGFVPEFMDWYLDENRQPGDYELVQTDYGYHIMYFSGSQQEWVRTCRDGVLREKSQKILDNATAQYPMEVTYKNIVLADVDLNQQ